MGEDEGLGLLLMVIGPLFAWVSSWLLYGYGEIIEKLGEIERNTHGSKAKQKAQEEKKEPDRDERTAEEYKSIHWWVCEHCKKERTQTPCEHCGKE